MCSSDLSAVGKTCAKCKERINHQWFVGHVGDELWCAECTTTYVGRRFGGETPEQIMSVPEKGVDDKSTEEEVIGNGGIDYRGRLCKCSECGSVSRCMPGNDFYVRSEGPENGPLVCERCLLGVAK